MTLSDRGGVGAKRALKFSLFENQGRLKFFEHGKPVLTCGKRSEVGDFRLSSVGFGSDGVSFHVECVTSIRFKVWYQRGYVLPMSDEDKFVGCFHVDYIPSKNCE